MEKIKVVILGGNGMLGHMLSLKMSEFENIELNRILRGTDNLNIGNVFHLDILHFNELERLLVELKPDFIINCIGLLVKASEINKKLAILTNSVLPNILDEISKQINSKLIHISTDCVFDGQNGPYHKNDIKNELNTYGLTKNLGELDNEHSLTIRTSIIGPELKEKGKGLFQWILSQNDKVSGYSEVYWSGVTTLELSNFILSEVIKSQNLYGLHHLTNGLCISKYELLLLIRDVFKLDVEIIKSSNIKSNKCLLVSKNLNYDVPSYQTMIEELAMHMIKNQNIY